MRFVKIFLDHKTSLLMGAGLNDSFGVSRKEYSLSLRKTIWFYNERSFFSLCLSILVHLQKIVPEIRCFLGKYPCFWEKIVFLRKSSLHFHQIPCQIMLFSDYVNSWKLVDFLKGLHFGKELSWYCKVMPRQVPFSRQLLIAFPIHYRTFMIFFIIFQFRI